MHSECPHCKGKLLVESRTQIRVFKDAETPPERDAPLTTDDVVAFLMAHGGATVREVQRSLQVKTAAEVYAILEQLVAGKRGEFVRRGRTLVFILPAEDLKQRARERLEREGCCNERELYRHLHASFAAIAATINLLIGDDKVRVTGDSPRMVHWISSCVCVE